MDKNALATLATLDVIEREYKLYWKIGSHPGNRDYYRRFWGWVRKDWFASRRIMQGKPWAQ